MNARNPDLTAWAIAAAMLLAGFGVMFALSLAGPPKPVERQQASLRETLEAPREVQGVPCRAYAQLDRAGRLTSCILDREHAFGPVVLPENTQFGLRPDGSVSDVHLGRDATYDGHACLGRGPGEWMTGFHPNGRLAYCFLASDDTIDGVPCRHGSFWGEVTGGVIVKFHDNGRLETCRLTADLALQDQVLSAGKRIHLNPDGSLRLPGAGLASAR